MKKLLFAFFLLISLLKVKSQTRDDAGLQGNQGAVSGFFETNQPVNYPAGAASWWHLLDVRHSYPANNYAMQFSGSFFDQNLYFRKTNNNASTSWSKVVTELNGKTELGNNYRIINIGDNTYGDYTRSLILLHEMYNGTLIDNNYAIGTITAIRGNAGSGHRLNIVNVNTGSAYNTVSGSLQSFNNYTNWKLKTCMYSGKRYLAVEVPYSPAFHNWGYKFSGYTSSTAENMLCISYEVFGQPVNQNLISNIQDFEANMTEMHETATFTITGNVGIGTETPAEKLSVNGKIRAKEIKVEAANWPDYVFKKGYTLPDIKALEKHIAENGHLPGIPTAEEVKKDGVALGEMNARLLKKIEELTLYVIDQNKRLEDQKDAFSKQINELRLEMKLNTMKR